MNNIARALSDFIVGIYQVASSAMGGVSAVACMLFAFKTSRDPSIQNIVTMLASGVCLFVAMTISNLCRAELDRQKQGGTP